MTTGFGVQEWTPRELKEKETAAHRAAKRRLMSVVRSQTPGEWEMVDLASTPQRVEFYLEVAALNAMLAWLNFPRKLRPYLDSIIGMCGSTANAKFTATNLELGKQYRIGRGARDESISKSVSRHKKQFLEWQYVKDFQLVDIKNGAFDPKRRKNNPTEYQVLIVEYAQRAVQLAKADADWGKAHRARRLKIIRKRARQVLHELDNCPPLDAPRTKTLSEEEKFDRRIHYQINAHLKNLDFADKMEWSTAELHAYVIHQFNKAFAKQRGLEGNLLTLPADEPETHAPVSSRLRSGILLEENPLTLEDLPEVRSVIPRRWRDGGWYGEEPANHRADKPGETVQNSPKTDCNLLNSKTHDGTFSADSREDNFVEKRRAEEADRLIRAAFDLAAKKLPPTGAAARFSERGAWQINPHNQTRAGRESEKLLDQARETFIAGEGDSVHLRQAIFEYLKLRLEYYQRGVPVAVNLEKAAPNLLGFVFEIDG